MPDVREYQSVLEEAEQAAGAGDFARANARLRVAMQLQEATLGTAHPDLASTLNNLAVVCETVGEIDDAERFYRRAYAIASGSRPPGDPLVATSRDNLQDFCAARGRPFEDRPGIADPAPAIVPPPAPVATRPAVAAPPAQAPSRPAPPAPQVAAAAADAAAWSKAIVAVVVLLAVAGAILLGRSWRTPAPEEGPTAVTPTPSAPPASTPSPAAAPATPPAAPPEPAAPVASAPTPPPARVAAPVAPTPAAPTATPPPDRSNSNAAVATPAGVRIVAANVCASLSTNGAWRCDAIDAVTAPGRAAFYTRIASPSALRVQHRWYQGTSLRQNVTLSIAANPSAGYRTFSRQTLSPGAWRVELRTADGAVLHEAAFDVR